MLKETDLSFETVNAMLQYDAASGVLTWRSRPASHFTDDRSARSWNTRCAGKPAGSMKSDGYVQVVITMHRRTGFFPAHRICCLLKTGTWPAALVDHQDGVKSNNRWKNLRPATTAQNAWNVHGLHPRNTSGFRGVSLHKPSGLWRAAMKVQGRRKSLGYFHTAEEAATARRQAELTTMGEFAPRSMT